MASIEEEMVLMPGSLEQNAKRGCFVCVLVTALEIGIVWREF